MSKNSEITEVKRENEMKRLQQHCASLKTRLEQSKRDFETLRKDFVKATEGENAKMSFKIYEEKRKAKEMADLQDKIMILENDYKVLTSEKDTLSESLEKAKSAADVLLDLKLAAECEVAVSAAKIEELENASLAFENKRKGLKRKLVKAREDEAEKQTELENLQKRFDSLSREASNLKEKARESAEKETCLLFENKRLTGEVKAYKNCVQYLFQEHCKTTDYFRNFPDLLSSTEEETFLEQSSSSSQRPPVKDEYLPEQFHEADSFMDEFGRRQ